MLKMAFTLAVMSLVTAGLSGKTVGLPAAAEAISPASSKPNLVVIMADDMRADDLRFMPSTRRLIRAKGLDFRNSFSPYPLCCPARASFLTGVFAHNHGVYHHDAPFGYASFDDSRSIATSLRRSGYNTGFVGKYLNGYGTQRSRVTGQPSADYVPNGWTDWQATLDAGKNSRYPGGTYNYFVTPFSNNGAVSVHRGYQTNELGNRAVRLVDEYAKAGRPFFLYVSSTAPHHGGPKEPDDPTLVKTPARPKWVTGFFDHITRAPGVPASGVAEADRSDKPRYMQHPAAPNRQLAEATRQRAEALLVLDRQVGRIIQKLRRTGELANTYVMLTSDNGYALGEHGQVGKIKPHEASLRVPLVIRGPGVPVGERYDPISTVDLTATIADLGRVERAPYPPDGQSRIATFTADQGWATPVVYEALLAEANGDDPLFADPRTAVGIRTAEWMYVRHASGEVELYDMVNDPLQMDSQHNNAAYDAIQASLDAVAMRYRNCAAAQCRNEVSELAVGPDRLGRLGRALWSAVRGMYG